MPLPPAPSPNGTSPALALAALDRRIADLDAEEDVSKHELSDLGAKIADAHARSLLRGRAFYRLTRAGMLPVGGGFNEQILACHPRRASTPLACGRAWGREALRERVVAICRARSSASRAIASRSRTQRGANGRRADRRWKTSRVVSRRSTAHSRHRRAGLASTSPCTARTARRRRLSHVGSGFSSSKGRLALPARRPRSRSGPSKRVSTDGPGLEIRRIQGAPVRAVFAGRVAFADRYGPYGRLVILDHGEHYYSVSGNLGAVDVKVGDDVSAGERIGTVGDDGQGAMLYFEVRHGTETLPPRRPGSASG